MFKNKQIGNNKFEVNELRKKRKMNPKKKAFTMFLTLVIFWILGFYLYHTYMSIEIDTGNYTTQRVQSTMNEQTVDTVTQKSKEIADILEETTKKVVGISKLKNAGSSIFSKSTESELGLGTGFIVSENGYIVSNEHVTGSKYSKCYITLETGDSYDGTVVWSDSDLDLSITKINAKNLPYVTLGDSDKIRIGETVYAIRKSNWVRI